MLLTGYTFAVVTCNVKKYDENLVNNDWAFVWFHYCSINYKRVVVLIHHNRSAEKYWRPLSAPLKENFFYFRCVDIFDAALLYCLLCFALG